MAILPGMRRLTGVAIALLIAPALAAQDPAETLLPKATLRALADELSGNTMKEHVARLTQIHRVPASPGFHEAVEYIRERLTAYGLSEIAVERFPADGTYFGTQRGNRGWRVDGGMLAEVSPNPRTIVDFQDLRVAVADNSENADVTAALVDVGSGVAARDYQGKDLKGKLVLADGPLAVVHRLAVEERGALGLVSYNSNQRTAWWRDDEDLVRWGHLDATGRTNTFGLMISLREARSLQQRLATGAPIVLHAVVKAHNDDTLSYETLVAVLPGTGGPAAGEIVFSCHLDHQKPGANDNASGCAANLEIARALKTLVDSKRIPAPRRTIRFVWPSEMTGTIAYLTRYPEIAKRIVAAVHLDMVGGDPAITKSVLHITRTPWSIAGPTDDLAEAFGRYVIEGAYDEAAGIDDRRSVRAAGGSKDAFLADVTPYEGGSDHWIYEDGSFRIPAVYLRDWPDIYIHTDKDLPDHIEPTKIKRSAFIAAASGYFLAAHSTDGFRRLIGIATASAHERLADDYRRLVVASPSSGSGSEDRRALFNQALLREQRRLRNIERLADASEATTLRPTLEERARNLESIWTSLSLPREISRSRSAADPRVPIRAAEPKGPLVPGSDWMRDKAGEAAQNLAIMRAPNGADVAWEIANFADGSRSVSEIRDAVSAEFEPVDLKAVAEYLDLLARIGAVTWKGATAARQ